MPSPTSSWSAPSCADLVFSTYRSEQSEAAKELDALCTQGAGMQLAFRRDTFHRRADNFARRHIVTAMTEGRMVAIGAVAIKELANGERAAFYFDLRVHPAARGRWLGSRLFRELWAWAGPQVTVEYAYAMADNHAARALMRFAGGRDFGGYCYAVLPTGRGRRLAAVNDVPGSDVHAEMRRVRGALRLLCDPYAEGRATPHAGAWLLRRGDAIAGCAAWSNDGILGEVVQRWPWHLALARPLLSSRALVRLGAPMLPKAGEPLRSWYLHDFFAGDPEIGRELVQHVLGVAREHGRDFCYLIGSDQERELAAVRRDFLPLFAPIIHYRAVARRLGGAFPFPDGTPLYVDPRDT